MPYDQDLASLYLRLGVIDSDPPNMGPHECCPKRETCWRSAESRKPPAGKGYSVSRPWIGKDYDRLKVLFLAINMNESGGIDEACKLVTCAREDIRAGRVRSFAKAGYRGTALYHRMAACAWAFTAAACDEAPKPGDRQVPTAGELADAFDSIAYTNQIKCSPTGAGSEPTVEMWRACGHYVLTAELNVLRPRAIVVLGTSDNFSYFQHGVLDGPPGRLPTGPPLPRVYHGTVSGRPVIVFVLPHPAWRRWGNSTRFVAPTLEAARATREEWA